MLEARGNYKVETIARSTTVRLMGARAAGSGVIVGRSRSLYSVLTNWHVVSLADAMPIALTADGRQHRLLKVRQLGRADLALAQFRSDLNYAVGAIAPAVEVGETVYAAGFPMYRSSSLEPTLNLGVSNFSLTQGQVTLRLPKPLDQGYGLGYSNEVVVGMSGGPIFNQRGQLVGVNGRVKDRDPGFGSYVFEDGTEPDGELLECLTRSSLGISIDRDMFRKL
ncbi:MAG: trypsin-like peptidase domain-containing protein [Alkalinema sp. RU_4_3]|nr:trypsin-like peptidase domain-containing protein [Alkalinema sp. RU_4_3]